MSMLDSFFSKGAFKGSKCKTLLKLTIPRIKLLRNRREIHIKQMRRDIAKLLETGQEATARIRVEHIIREEKMMAAQEIVELFCELVVVRLPIIEAQRECPLDLKEAISSLCFAAPRCADLPELLQVQMSFAAKYGKEFVAAATELLPECGVNRQLIEHLSVRAPAPDVKLKLLKEIAEEHELDWDPTASETELLKPHEDLLNGPTHFVSGSNTPLPQENLKESVPTAPEQTHDEHSDSDADFDILDFPEVPNSLMKNTPSSGPVSAPEMLPFSASALSDLNHDSETHSESNDDLPYKTDEILEKPASAKTQERHEKQFLPFISPPPETPPPPSFAPSVVPKTKSDTNKDLEDVVAAAHAAAENAERAAAAARSAASLAQLRISELVKKQNENDDDTSAENVENPFFGETRQSNIPEKSNFDRQTSLQEYDNVFDSSSPPRPTTSNVFDSSSPPRPTTSPGGFTARYEPQRLPSMDDEGFMSYPNLFGSQSQSQSAGDDRSRAQSFADNTRPSDER